MNKSVFGLVRNEEHVQRILGRLTAAGFVQDEISILAPKSGEEALSGIFLGGSKKTALGTEKHTKAPEGGASGAAAGGVIGGSLGLLIGMGILSLPGLGIFVAAGPILAALSGSALGGSLGLAIGTFVGWGIPKYEAKQYEAGLKDGHILMSIHGDTDEELRTAKAILEKNGAMDISITNDTSHKD